MLERVQQRYYLYVLPQLMLSRIDELDAQFANLRVREQEWPTPLPHAKPMYKKICYTYLRPRSEYRLCLLRMYLSRYQGV